MMRSVAQHPCRCATLPAGVEGQVKLAPTTVATLELSPEDALRVTHAANFAKELQLIIRRLDEENTSDIPPAQFIGGERASGQNTNDTVPAPTTPDGTTPDSTSGN